MTGACRRRRRTCWTRWTRTCRATSRATCCSAARAARCTARAGRRSSSALRARARGCMWTRLARTFGWRCTPGASAGCSSTQTTRRCCTRRGGRATATAAWSRRSPLTPSRRPTCVAIRPSASRGRASASSGRARCCSCRRGRRTLLKTWATSRRWRCPATTSTPRTPTARCASSTSQGASTTAPPSSLDTCGASWPTALLAMPTMRWAPTRSATCLGESTRPPMLRGGAAPTTTPTRAVVAWAGAAPQSDRAWM
mmetsp:Transcript_908/g.2870  ORF Transcript_908/g.2870 Transcript_908/m.2870 type:complete len:255 (+) Transcript_908:1797-2561(+)